MPTDKTADAYLTTKVMTASPEELRLLLIEGAIRFGQKGRDALASADFASMCDGYGRARDIILELVNSMRPEVSPELCKQVAALYMFIYRLLVESGLERSLAKADRAIELLHYERETWIMLMSKLAEDRTAAAEMIARHTAQTAGRQPVAAAPRDPAAYTPLSIAG